MVLTIDNCPVLKDDVGAAEEIFDTNLSSVKGDTIRQVTESIRTRITHLLTTILSIYKTIELVSDIMMINCLILLTTTS